MWLVVLIVGVEKISIPFLKQTKFIKRVQCLAFTRKFIILWRVNDRFIIYSN